jgi:hypothetical protein
MIRSLPNRLFLCLALSGLLLVPAAPARAQATLRFVAFGDIHGGGANVQRVANLVAAWKPDVVTTTGDNSYTGSTAGYDAETGAYYHSYIYYPPGHPSVYANQGSTQNHFYPAVGNHDWDDGIAPFQAYFTLPGNERYYDVVQGPVHFFFVDAVESEPDGTTSTSVQAQWLQGALAASSARWKIVILHYPPYTSGDVHSNATALQWPFEAWGASAVLSGHNHNYERILKGRFPYFVVGTGGSSLYGFKSPPESGSMVRYNADYGALVVDATSETLLFRFYAAGGGGSGTLIDSFSLPVAATGGGEYSETFEGFTTDQTVGSGAGWFDDAGGPVVRASNGVAGSRGLDPAENIFVWSAHPFTWSDAAFDRAVFQMDFQASAGGTVPFFDDDRIGWMTTASSVSSDYFFGVQLDPVTDPNTGLRIEAYWRNANDARVAVPIADLTGVVAGAWYRLRLEVTKLGVTTAALTATLQALDGGGQPGAVVASGSIGNTGAILPDTLRPHTRYFVGAAYPAFKNFSPLAGAADNAHTELPTGGTSSDDALAWWAFDDGTGSVAADGSGNGNTATVSGATWTSGRFDGALAFDGVNDRVVVPSSPSLDRMSSAMTVAFWVRGDVLDADWVTALQRSNAAGNWFDWQLYTRAVDAPSPNRPVFRVDWDGDGVIDPEDQVGGDIVLSAGTWYHVACTYDGAWMRFYIDGTLRGSVAKAGGIIPNGGHAIWMGGNDIWGEYFGGRLDDVRFYDRALSGAEIQALMSGPTQYRVDVAVMGSGSVTRVPDQVLYDRNQVVRLTAVPSPGWTFTGWSGDLTGTTNPGELTVTRDMWVRATFVLSQSSSIDTLTAAGAIWKYRDDGSDQGTAWRGLGFADGSWATGHAQLGYGDGDERTVVGYGPDPDNKYVTTYFRHSFELPEAGVHNSLMLDLLRDDGAIVYLNGVEVFRSHMPAGTVTYSTWAASPAVGDAEESAWFSSIVDPALLRTGTNVLAVEIHQVNATSTDISFDLRLTGSVTLGSRYAEGFDGLPAPSLLHDQPGWRDDGAGPSIVAGGGVGGSHGLSTATDIFTWVGRPFSWTDPIFQRAIFELDFQSSAGGTAALFDDDRIGWMTSSLSALSDSTFGVQLDPLGTSGGPNIEVYWRDATGARVDSPLVDLSGLIAPDSWYRLRLEVLKLGPASARLDVALSLLDAEGSPAAVVATGALESTDALGAGAPAARFFTVPTLYPAFKNYNAVAGAADNAMAQIVTSLAPPIQLGSLTATATGPARVRVDWTTLTETGNAGFEVQKSTDSLGGYATIAGCYVSGHGTTRVSHAYGYTDSTAVAGTWYYRLRQVSRDGSATHTDGVRVTVTVGVADPAVPLAFALERPMPNPSRGTTTIRYALSRDAPVSLEVFSVTGQKVATLTAGPQKAGRHAVRWEPRGLASGVYWYRLVAPGFSATQKILVLQ